MSKISVFKDLREQFLSLGYELYLVGGAVRDMLLDITPADLDLCSNISPLVLIKNFNLKDDKYRSQFYSYTVLYKEYEFELTLLRADISYSNNRSALVRLVNNLRQDSLRRDFTINAIYYSNQYHDLRLGMIDLRNKQLRFIQHPIKKVYEDPIRIIRALYFAIKLNFNIYYKDLIFIKANSFLLKKYKSYLKKYISKMIQIDRLKTKKILAILNIGKDVVNC